MSLPTLPTYRTAKGNSWGSASLQHYMGIPGELFTCVFAASRVAGWCAHVLEQWADNKIIRPSSNYTGPAERESAMLYGLYLSAQGAQVQTLRQEVVSNNLANAATTSFKRDLVTAQSHLP